MINDHLIYSETLLQSWAQAPAEFPWCFPWTRWCTAGWPCHLLTQSTVADGRVTMLPGAPGEHQSHRSVGLRSWHATAENFKEVASVHAILNGSDKPVCSGCCSHHCFRFSQIMGKYNKQNHFNTNSWMNIHQVLLQGTG